MAHPFWHTMHYFLLVGKRKQKELGEDPWIVGENWMSTPSTITLWRRVPPWPSSMLYPEFCAWSSVTIVKWLSIRINIIRLSLNSYKICKAGIIYPMRELRLGKLRHYPKQEKNTGAPSSSWKSAYPIRCHSQWAKCLYSFPDSYAKALTLNVMVFGGRVFGEKLK